MNYAPISTEVQGNQGEWVRLAISETLPLSAPLLFCGGGIITTQAGEGDAGDVKTTPALSLAHAYLIRIFRTCWHSIPAQRPTKGTN